MPNVLEKLMVGEHLAEDSTFPDRESLMLKH